FEIGAGTIEPLRVAFDDRRWPVDATDFSCEMRIYRQCLCWSAPAAIQNLRGGVELHALVGGVVDEEVQAIECDLRQVLRGLQQDDWLTASGIAALAWFEGGGRRVSLCPGGASSRHGTPLITRLE